MVGVVGLEPTTLNPQSSGSTAELHPDARESNRGIGRRVKGRAAKAEQIPVGTPAIRISSIDQGQGPPRAGASRSSGIVSGIGTVRGPVSTRGNPRQWETIEGTDG